MYRTIRLCCAGVMAFAVALALGGLAQAAELKIGYAEVGKLFDGYQRTKDSEQILEQRGKQKQAELEGRLGELKKMRQSLELMSDQARDAKGKELEERSDEFQRLKTRTERELVRSRNELARDILGEIDKTIKEYAAANGFTLIFDSRSLVHAESALDVTAPVLKALNDHYAAGGGKKP